MLKQTGNSHFQPQFKASTLLKREYSHPYIRQVKSTLTKMLNSCLDKRGFKTNEANIDTIFNNMRVRDGECW